MRNKGYVLIILLINILITVSCVSKKQIKDAVSAFPVKQILIPDTSGVINMDLTFDIPEHYISKRSRLIIVPQLFVDDSMMTEFTPIIVDAPVYKKKLDRRKVLDNYVDSFQNYVYEIGNTSRAIRMKSKESFYIPDNMQTGCVYAAVSLDGCGECTGIDTLHVADISNPASLIDLKKEYNLEWIEPDFVVRPKIREGRGEALLQFVINKYDIKLELGKNREELNRMTETLGAILSDTLASVNHLGIYGMASADGPYKFNEVLARNRALAAKNWLVKKLDINDDIKGIIQVGSKPEGWWPVYHAMVNDGHPDSLDVKKILDSYNGKDDDFQEYHIRALPCWKDIRNKYLQKDRKVEYTYNYTLRSFTTDDELMLMYKTRPDAFNEDELMRVAALVGNDSLRIGVYSTIMKYFPQSDVAANNLAIIYLRNNRIDMAEQTIKRQKEYSEEMINTLAACYVYADDDERAVELLQNVELPQARYNLGLLKAHQRRLEEAYDLLKDYRDINSAIIALSVSRNGEAESIMNELEDKTPLAEYVRALISARFNNEKDFRTHLHNACQDESLSKRSRIEPDFERFLKKEVDIMH